MMLNVSLDFNHGSVCWGSPWSQHALLCLLVDVIENERMLLNAASHNASLLATAAATAGQSSSNSTSGINSRISEIVTDMPIGAVSSSSTASAVSNTILDIGNSNFYG
jgi:hypothetical protein